MPDSTQLPAEPVKPETKPVEPPKGAVPTKPPKGEQLPAPTKAERLKQLSDKLGEILKGHGGLESNVPLNHEYWAVKAESDVVRNLPE